MMLIQIQLRQLSAIRQMYFHLHSFRICIRIYIYALKNNFLMCFFNRNYSSTPRFAVSFRLGRMMTTKVREVYITFGLGSHKTTSQWKNHLCSPGCIIYLSSQNAADTNITNTRLWVSITGINSLWPGWILFPSLAAPMCQCKFWIQSEQKW